jgi:hypothetical protein
MHEPMVGAGAVRHHYALAYDLRTVHAFQIAAMVEGDVSYLGILVASVGAISYLPIALPIPYAVFAADIDAKIDRFKDHIFGSNLRPDHVVEQAVVIEISLERCHARVSFFLELLPKRTTLYIPSWAYRRRT